MGRVMRAEFETYYLVQRSNTGYAWQNAYATRSLHDAYRHLDEHTDGWHHRRIINAKTKKVLKIRRPGVEW
jgi:hypothetical protein